MIVYTTSYEGLSLDGFLAGLQAQGVRLLADVREAPISRKPGFSKSALSAALQQAGMEYQHLRALGCPKPIRDAYKQDGDWVRYTRDFMQHLGAQRAAVEELAKRCDELPTALLCYEADFNRCHRTYVARAVGACNGAIVCHITAAGVVMEPEPSPS